MKASRKVFDGRRARPTKALAYIHPRIHMGYGVDRKRLQPVTYFQYLSRFLKI